MRRRGRRGLRGVSMVEFALVAPLAFLVILGALDFGRAAYDNSVTANAAREGARAAIPSQLNDTTKTSAQNLAGLQSAVDSAVRRTLGGGVTVTNSVVKSSLGACPSATLGKTAVCVVTPNAAFPSGQVAVTVQVSYSFQPWVPLVNKFFNKGNGFILTSSTTMTTEY